MKQHHKIVLAVIALFCLILTPQILKQDESTQKDAVIQELTSLGYIQWGEIKGKDKNKSNVTYFDENKSYPGLNLYSSRPDTHINLMDMQGNIIHYWEPEIKDNSVGIFHVEPAEADTIYAIIDEERLLKIGYDSKIIWEKKGRFHHDLAVDEDSNLYVLDQKPIKVTVLFIKIPVMDNLIRKISKDGEILETTSINDLFYDQISTYKKLKMIHTYLFKGIKDTFKGIDGPHWDLYHANTLEIITQDKPSTYAKGDILTCLRNQETIAILDAKTKKIKWSWGPGTLSHPHQPTMLENGNILVFDNGWRRNYSRIIEVDPATKEIQWMYGEKQKTFYSKRMGGNQQLPNGNILITEAENGRVFEITPKGEKVWEFYNPETTIENETKKRASIYRMTRLNTNYLNQTEPN